MKITPIYVAALILILAGGALAYDSFTSSLNPYLTVSQASADPGASGKEVQILATLSSWSVDDAGAMHLIITDESASLAVNYAGVPPQSLQQGQKIVAIGALTSQRTMNATRLLVKCPSKYE